ncbi:phospholipase [Paenibacillus albicereus]|uniref:phospholipase D n=1 Tax=Paenibacillus albicereus TaxID=2726185 RepID=A0A6H2H349_9BACL|nr:phospholipase D-like domain-containing protein [Paenibacillus albicereus]QJC54019.1 phospholipase [Paenibacillus albicereus]
MPLALALLLLYAGVVIYHANKPLPSGVSFEGAVHPVPKGGLELLTDLTYEDEDGGKTTEQAIFARMLRAIGEAERFVVLDLFLFNGYYNEDQSFPPLSRPVADALIARKKELPELSVTVITDDVNTSYGSHPAPDLERLRQAGIPVVVTDVDPLRDSNPLYTAAWRLTAGWISPKGQGWLPNKMATGAPDMTVRSYLKLVNAKANHRKVLITEDTLVVASANAHDASFYNSNSGYAVTGVPKLLAEALRSEQAAIDLSGSNVRLPGPDQLAPAPASDTPSAAASNPASSASASTSAADAPAASAAEQASVQLLTEGRIRAHVLRDLDAAQAGDRIWLGMFYLADRDVVQALVRASDRGAQVRLILDPNEVAFGNSKIGVPNRPVAAELRDRTEGRIEVRWYNTDQEQYHAKLMLVAGRDGAVIHNGSANFTTRNLDDLNLETNLRVQAGPDSRPAAELEAYFRKLWTNDGARYTLDYSEYEEKTEWIKRILYRVQDRLGFTTF